MSKIKKSLSLVDPNLCSITAAMTQESDRLSVVQTPIIPTVGALIQATPGTISLGQGVVFYPPPPAAIAQITQFLADPNNHKYQAVEGIPELQSCDRH